MTSHEKSRQQVTFAQYQQPSNYPYNVARGSGYFCFHRGNLHLVLTVEYKGAPPSLHIIVQLFLASFTTSLLSLFGPISMLNACHIITSHHIRLIMHWPRGFVCTLNVSYLLMSYKICQFMSHLRGCLLNPCRSSMLPARSTTCATTGNWKMQIEVPFTRPLHRPDRNSSTPTQCSFRSWDDFVTTHFVGGISEESDQICRSVFIQAYRITCKRDGKSLPLF